MRPSKLQAAQAKLESILIGALGEDLPGVTGYGPRWDNALNGVSLGVTVDEGRDPAAVQSRLPESINDLPVRVFVQAPARA